MADQRTNENEVPGDAGYDPKRFSLTDNDIISMMASITEQTYELRKSITILETKVNMIQNKIGGK